MYKKSVLWLNCQSIRLVFQISSGRVSPAIVDAKPSESS